MFGQHDTNMVPSPHPYFFLRISAIPPVATLLIVVNDKSEKNTAKHVSREGLLHYKFIIQFSGERVYKIGEHLVTLQARWLIVSYAPFTLDCCPQRCRTRRISKILLQYGQKLLMIVVVLKKLMTVIKAIGAHIEFRLD